MSAQASGTLNARPFNAVRFNGSIGGGSPSPTPTPSPTVWAAPQLTWTPPQLTWAPPQLTWTPPQLTRNA